MKSLKQSHINKQQMKIENSKRNSQVNKNIKSNAA